MLFVLLALSGCSQNSSSAASADADSVSESQSPEQSEENAEIKSEAKSAAQAENDNEAAAKVSQGETESQTDVHADNEAAAKTSQDYDISEHIIPYPAGLITTEDEEGADSFDNLLDDRESRYFIQHDYYHMESADTLHIITGFKTYQQTTEYSCGAAAALMVLDHFGIDKYNEMEIVEKAGTDTTKGTSVEGLAGFFESEGFETDSHAGTDYRFGDIDEAEAYIIDSIDAGIPVMVDWLDWRGHWQVIIGIDSMSDIASYDDVLILADSYDVTDHLQDGYYTFSLGRFFDMWREGVCAGKDVPYEQPFVKAWPKGYAADANVK